ncbi:MAG: hypothetical protein U0Q22_06160 [Acidimicrobiales bacterium]
MGARRRETRRAGWATVMAVVLAVVAAACTPGTGTLGSGPWQWTEVRVNAFVRSQGLATDATPLPGQSGDSWYTSQFTLEHAGPDGGSLGITGSLPLDVLAIWKNSHTGDPDADGGRVVVPWENKQLGPSDPPTKSFGVYEPTSLQLLGWSKHVLGAGETNDNPWVAIAPGGSLMVTGTYSPLGHLEVYPVPAPPYADLPLVDTIPLDQPGYEVQGCDFVTATRLACASNDEATGKQLFLLDLDGPVGQAGNHAHLTYEGPIPQAAPLLGDGVSFCGDSGEVEGIDAQHVAGVGTVVRVLVVDRCLLVVHEYSHVIAD